MLQPRPAAFVRHVVIIPGSCSINFYGNHLTNFVTYCIYISSINCVFACCDAVESQFCVLDLLEGLSAIMLDIHRKCYNLFHTRRNQYFNFLALSEGLRTCKFMLKLVTRLSFSSRNGFTSNNGFFWQMHIKSIKAAINRASLPRPLGR